ncbi:MAG: ABC-2 transporter permease [Ruminococcus sp.]|jgi:ABC-2 type transport system permease protein
MKGLLIKDFKLMKAQKNFFVVFLVICVAMLAATEDAVFAIGFLGFGGALFTLSSISYDEFENGNAFLFSLPITRKKYVGEKYGFGLIMGSCGWLLGVIVTGIFSMAKGKSGLMNELPSMVVLLSVVMIMLALMIPVHLKFGGERGRIVILAVVGVIVVLGFFAGRLQKTLGIDLSGPLSWLSSLDESVLAPAALLASFAILLLSCALSCRIMLKKEF